MVEKKAHLSCRWQVAQPLEQQPPHRGGTALSRDHMFSRPARAARVDLRRVSTLDLERVARTVDIDALEAQLDAVLSSKLSEGELRRLGGAGSTQLFRLMQMLVEYLLHVQQTLYSRGMELEHAAQVTSSQLLEQDSLRIKTGRPLRSSTFHSSPHK